MPRWGRTRAAVVAALLGGLVGPLGALAHPAGAVAPPAPAACGPARAVSAWPIDRQVAQVVMAGTTFAELANAVPLAGEGIGAVLVSGQPDAGAGPAISAGIAQVVAASGPGGVEPWIATDEEGGDVQRLAGVIGAMVSPRELAEGWSPAGARDVVARHARAMRALGVSMDLAPVLAVAPAGTSGILASRSFGDDPATVADYAVAFVDGLRDGGVVPVVKHFPGIGRADGRTDLVAARTPPFDELEATDVVPFRRAVDRGVEVVMVANAIVPGLTDGLPASLAPATYAVLRDELAFEGVAMTDALGAGAIAAAGYDVAAAAERALAAGADMVVLTRPDETGPVLARLRAAVEAGRVPRARLHEAVERVLAAKGLATCHSVAIAADPSGTGLWSVGPAGEVDPRGDAAALGDLAGRALTRPAVGIAATPTGHGYWLVASDGGIFAFGDATFHGSTGDTTLNQPIVGMAPTPTGHGYWLAAADGGIFAFGDATFHGSTGDTTLNQPIVGMAPTPTGHGYWLAAADGGIFAFGDAPFHGSAAGSPLDAPAIGIVGRRDGGYAVMSATGAVRAFGPDPAWSPSGDAIASVSTGNGLLNPELYRVAPDGTGTTRITSNQTVDASPDW